MVSAAWGALASRDLLVDDDLLPLQGMGTEAEESTTFNEDAYAPLATMSCCQLDVVATEFSSQELELDAALLAWGSAFIHKNGAWSIRMSRGTRGKLRDPKQLRKNVYRVRLTRGWDGTVVYVPVSPRLDKTWRYLVACGMRPLAD